MSRVILVDNPRREFDTSGLAIFGEIVNIRDELSSPFKPGFEASLVYALKEINFNPEEDRIALLGRQMQVALSLLVAQQVYGSLKLLVYSNSDDSYTERVLTYMKRESVTR